MKNIFSKLIVSTIIILIALELPLVGLWSVKTANAEVDITSVVSSVVGSSLGCAASQEIGAGITALKGIFTGVTAAEDALSQGKDTAAQGQTKGAEAAAQGTEAGETATSVPVTSKSLGQWASSVNTTAVAQGKADAEGIKKKEEQSTWQVIQDKCIKVMEKAIAKALLDDLTNRIVGWINSGFNGNPFYLQNHESFFNDIAKQSINGFVSVVGFDPVNFPYGRDEAKQLLTDAKSNFEARSKYNLPDVIGTNNAEKFSLDFTAGGWAGWMATTQSSSNNPIAYHFEANNELAKTLRGTYSSPAEKLQNDLFTGSGFLSMDKCVDPSDYEPESKDPTWTRNYAVDEVNLDQVQGQAYASATEWLRKHTCKRWETQTPGHFIATQLDVAGTAKEEQLINANDIDSALGSIFDALLNQGIKQIVPDEKSDATTGGNAGDSSLFDLSGNTQVSNTNNQGNPNIVNVKTDLAGVLKLQNDYKQGLIDYITSLNKLIYSEKQLDLCVPGPFQDPVYDWTRETDKNIDAIENDWVTNYNSPAYIVSAAKKITGFQAPEVVDYVTAKNYLDSLYVKYKAEIASKYDESVIIQQIPYYPGLYKKEIARIYLNGSKIDDTNSEILQNDPNIGKLIYLKQQADATNDQAQLTKIKDDYDNLSYLLKNPKDLDLLKDKISTTDDDTKYTSRFLVEDCIAKTSSNSYAGPVGRREYAGVPPIYTYANNSTYIFPYTYSVNPDSTFLSGKKLPDYNGVPTTSNWSTFEKNLQIK